MIITTTHSVEGQPIKKYLGVINANIVIGTNFFSDLAASITDFLGGFSDSYQNKLFNIYKTVMSEIEVKAKAIGADAIVGLRIDFDEISGKEKSMFMVSATGTAVLLYPQLDSKHKMFDELSTLFDYRAKGILSDSEYENEKEKIIASYQYSINESLEIINEKNAVVKKRLEEEERRALEEKRIKDEARQKVHDHINKIMNEECSIELINSVEESYLECCNIPIPPINIDLETFICRLLRVNKVLEAIKYCIEKNGCSFPDAKAYVLDVFSRIDSIDRDNYTRLVNKLRVLKSKGFFQQAINEYMKYSFTDADTAKHYIENLS